MEEALPDLKARERNYVGDALRGVAAYMVFASHLAELFLAPVVGLDSPWIGLTRALAYWSVLVFFALSGYVIAGSLDRARRGYGIDFWRPYLANRIARIYPPLLASMALCILVAGLAEVMDWRGPLVIGVIRDASEVLAFDPFQFGAALFHLQAFFPQLTPALDNPLWSLGIEGWLYLTAMAIVGITSRSPWPHAGVLAVTAGLCLAGSGNVADIFRFTLFWTFGVAAYFAHARLDPAFVRRAATGVLLVSLPAIAGFALTWVWPLQPAPFVAGFMVDVCVTLAAVAVLLRGGGILARHLAPLGAYSYSLYLMHYPVLLAASAWLFNGGRVPEMATLLLSCGAAGLTAVAISRSTARVTEDTTRFRRWGSFLWPATPQLRHGA